MHTNSDRKDAQCTDFFLSCHKGCQIYQTVKIKDYKTLNPVANWPVVRAACHSV